MTKRIRQENVKEGHHKRDRVRRVRSRLLRGSLRSTTVRGYLGVGRLEDREEQERGKTVWISMRMMSGLMRRTTRESVRTKRTNHQRRGRPKRQRGGWRWRGEVKGKTVNPSSKTLTRSIRGFSKVGFFYRTYVVFSHSHDTRFSFYSSFPFLSLTCSL